MATPDTDSARYRDATKDNFPGFAYVSRVVSAASAALMSHAEEMNHVWEDIRSGEFSLKKAMQSSAKVTENYFGVVNELVRGPIPFMRPAWLVIPYVKKSDVTMKYNVPIDTVVGPTDLTYTKLARFGPGDPVDVYARPPRGEGSRVYIELDKSVLEKLDTRSEYVGFIFRKGGGAEAPLVIVVLQVTEKQD